MTWAEEIRERKETEKWMTAKNYGDLYSHKYKSDVGQLLILYFEHTF